MFQQVNCAMHVHSMETGEKPKNIFLGKSEKRQLEVWLSEYGFCTHETGVVLTGCDFSFLGMNGYFVSAESLLRVTN